MSDFKSEEVSRALRKKGFSAVNSHHIFFRLTSDGSKAEARTYISHGAKSISSFLQGKMAKQLGLTVAEFHDLVRCPLTEDKLRQILKKRGKL